jgi:serine/threonine protein kinase
MDDEYRPGYGYQDENAQQDARNNPGSQSSPQDFKLPPTLVAHFPALPAPPHPTDLLIPFSSGSTSDLFRAIIKRPNPISLEINGELHSNAADVAIQFAAELRVYRKVGKHSGFVAYLGCVEGLGMVLEWVEGPTLLDVLRGPAPPNPRVKMPPHENPSKKRRIVWYNQLVDALVHLHSFGLNHGDLSLLNIHVEKVSDSIKLIDFGRSVSVLGYPCQHLYLPEPEPSTPTVRSSDTLPAAPQPQMFKPGGAWVEPETRQGRPEKRGAARPKLFDRSTNSSGKSSLAVPLDDPSAPPISDLPSRPITHASRLLQQHSNQSSSSLGTHMPVTMSRSRHAREALTISRPSSASPVQTRFHLATSPMSPHGPPDGGFDMTDDRGHEYEQEDWMQVDAYGGPPSASSSSRVYGYGPHPSRHDSSNYGLDPHYYLQSPGHSHPSSRRASRSPSRYATAADYANDPRNMHRHHYSRRSHSNSRYSRSPHREWPSHGTPQHYGYPADPRGGSYPHTPIRQPPAKPPPKPEPIHPGSRPFCAPEILRAPSGSCIDSRTKQWVDPILADAYSLGVILVCMDLCKLIDIGNERQKKEE